MKTCVDSHTQKKREKRNRNKIREVRARGSPSKSSWVLVFFLQRIIIQATIPPMRSRRRCPIPARSWAEAFPSRALRLERDRLWVPRRRRAKSRSDAPCTVRARNVVRRSALQRFPRRRAPDPKRGVLARDVSRHRPGCGHGQDRRAHRHGHRDLAGARRRLASSTARRTRHE